MPRVLSALTALVLVGAFLPGLGEAPAQATAPVVPEVSSADEAARLDPATTSVRIRPGAADAAAAAVAKLAKLDRVDARGSGLTDAGLRSLAAAKLLTHLDVSDCPSLTDTGVQELAVAKRLETLRLSGAEKVGDASLAVLGKLGRLRILELAGCRAVTDAGLEGIRELPKIEELDLSRIQLSDKGTQHLARLRTLKALRLNCTAIPDISMLHIVALGDLECLEVAGNSACAFGQIGLLHVNGLRKLRRLDVSQNDRVTDEVLRSVALCPALEELRATDCKKVTDAGVALLAKSKALRDADLSGTAVGVKGAAALAPIRTLARLRLAACPNLAADHLVRLRSALPKVEIVTE